MKADELINSLREWRDYYSKITQTLQDAANVLEETYLADLEKAKEQDDEDK